jgi:hypothetical protein
MAGREFQNFPTENISNYKKSKAVPLYATETLGGRGDKAPTHSRPHDVSEARTASIIKAINVPNE